MNEQDEKLLRLYKNSLRKKRILVFTIIIFLIGISLYYFYTNYLKNSNENIENTLENTISTNDENKITINSIKEENTGEQKIDNSIIQNEVEEKTEEKEINLNTNEDVKTESQVEKNGNKPIETSKEVKKDTVENNNKNNTSEKPKNKDFLFTDGYTMENVTQAAQNYLKSYNWSGECIPIKDSEGVYLGMRVIFY